MSLIDKFVIQILSWWLPGHSGETCQLMILYKGLKVVIFKSSTLYVTSYSQENKRIAPYINI